MTYENTQYEERINLLALVASILRKWKWLLMVAFMGAFVFGLYFGVLHPEQAGSETEIEELQEALDKNIATLSDNEDEIAANERSIVEKQENIAADEELLVTRQEQKETWEETLAALRTALERVEEVLADSGASTNQIAEAVAQMFTLKDDITDADSKLTTASNRVSNTEKEITELQSDIEKMTASNEKLEKNNEELRQEIKEQEAEMERLTGSAGRGPVIKYAMVGAVLGAFAICGVICLQFVLYKKLRAADELKEQYGFPILGEFFSAAAKEHKKFDRMLDKLAGDIQTLPEEQQVYKLIAAGIQTPAFPLPMQLVVTGTVREEALREVGSQLCSLLPEGYRVAVAANPVYTPGPLANLKQFTVLLVEKKGVSDKREIAKLAEVLWRNEVKVIGAVVL